MDDNGYPPEPDEPEPDEPEPYNLARALKAAGFDASQASPLQHHGPCVFWRKGVCTCPIRHITAALAAVPAAVPQEQKKPDDLFIGPDGEPWLALPDHRDPTIGKNTLQGAFLCGAKWWEWESTGGTMWASDRDKAWIEAERRYPAAFAAEKQEKKTLQQVEAAAILDAVCAVLDGERVSDFMESFPVVRQVQDLKVAALAAVPPPNSYNDPPHIREDYREVWQSGFRAALAAVETPQPAKCNCGFPHVDESGEHDRYTVETLHEPEERERKSDR